MGSDETAMATTGGPRVIDVFDGNGAPSGPYWFTFFGGRSAPGGLSGSPRVGTIHVQAATPHAPPLQSFLAEFSQQPALF